MNIPYLHDITIRIINAITANILIVKLISSILLISSVMMIEANDKMTMPNF